MTPRLIVLDADEVRELLTGKVTIERPVRPQGGPCVKPYRRPDGLWTWVMANTGVGGSEVFDCPHGLPGQRLWVVCRENDGGSLFLRQIDNIVNTDVEVQHVDGVWKWRTTLERVAQ